MDIHVKQYKLQMLQYITEKNTYGDGSTAQLVRRGK